MVLYLAMVIYLFEKKNLIDVTEAKIVLLALLILFRFN
jgi:hypothetical protein